MDGQNVSLRIVFEGATKFLGFIAEEQLRLLNGNVDGETAFTHANIGATCEGLAQLAIAVGITMDDQNEVHRFMRDKNLPDLEGQSIAECVLSGSPEKMRRSISVAERHLGLT